MHSKASRNCRHASKMSRSTFSAEHLTDFFPRRHRRFGPCNTSPRHSDRTSDAPASRAFLCLGFIPGIFLEILRRSELHGIHKNRNNRFIIFRRALSYQRQMPLMHRAHRGHASDALPLDPSLMRPSLHFARIAHDRNSKNGGICNQRIHLGPPASRAGLLSWSAGVPPALTIFIHKLPQRFVPHSETLILRRILPPVNIINKMLRRLNNRISQMRVLSHKPGLISRKKVHDVVKNQNLTVYVRSGSDTDCRD